MGGVSHPATRIAPQVRFGGLAALRFCARLIGAGAGVIDLVVGLVAGGLSFGIGQFALGPAKSMTERVAVVAVFAAPAAIAGLLFDLRDRAALHPCRELETGLSVIGSAFSQRLRSVV